MSDRLKAGLAIPFVMLIGLGFAYAGSGGQLLAVDGGLHPFTLAVAVAFVIQWLAFIPAYIWQTERYFDLIGSLTYITVAFLAFFASPTKDWRTYILLAMVLLWAGRLGTFLFMRISKTGKDGRFDDLKQSFVRFAAAWTLQALWVTFTAAAALAAMGTRKSMPVDAWAVIGCIVWIVGYTIEAVADHQKSKFKADPKNEGDFIDVGLWSRSRHPNYFGEIVIWTGVAIVAFTALEGWQFLTLLSPVFVSFLLMKVSGVPLLEEKADKKWGGQEDYERYKRTTPIIVPKLY